MLFPFCPVLFPIRISRIWCSCMSMSYAQDPLVAQTAWNIAVSFNLLGFFLVAVLRRQDDQDDHMIESGIAWYIYILGMHWHGRFFLVQFLFLKFYPCFFWWCFCFCWDLVQQVKEHTKGKSNTEKQSIPPEILNDCQITWITWKEIGRLSHQN